MTEVNPEQTAPLLSLVLYSFLDPTIFKAHRVSHMPPEQLPPLADYDYSKNLVKRSFKVLFSSPQCSFLTKAFSTLTPSLEQNVAIYFLA